jgi:hypothetical protein
VRVAPAKELIAAAARIGHTGAVARRSALAGSLAVHGAIVLVAAIIARAPSADRSEPPRTVEIELVGPSPAPPSPQSPANAGGAAPASAPAPRPTQRARSESPRRADPDARSSHTRSIAPPAARRSALADEVTMRIEPPSAGAGDVSGGCDGGEPEAPAGAGRGIGFGAGRGDSDAALAAYAVPTPDLVPRPSQAQPPYLIYPRRNRDVDERTLFVARLTIDTDGYVVGAQLLGGRGERGAERAANAVWRFRYRPARDATGRPITVTIDQRFLVDD